MPEQDGLNVGIAFNAVRQCHQDIGRLIADLDGFMGKTNWKRFGNQDSVTWGTSRSAYSPYWMAKQVYRLYQNEDAGPLVLEGINIRFFEDDRSLDQPRLVIGRVAYMTPPTSYQSWDLDEGYHKWCNAQVDDLGKVLLCNNESKGVAKMLVVAVNLYSVQKLGDVTAKLMEVRQRFDLRTD